MCSAGARPGPDECAAGAAGAADTALPALRTGARPRLRVRWRGQEGTVRVVSARPRYVPLSPRRGSLLAHLINDKTEAKGP